jgi:hypothetical protein
MKFIILILAAGILSLSLAGCIPSGENVSDNGYINSPSDGNGIGDSDDGDNDDNGDDDGDLDGDEYEDLPVIDSEAYAASKAEGTVDMLELPSIFSDGMILQRNAPIHIYGRAINGNAVKATLSGPGAEDAAGEITASDTNGYFVITLPRREAGAGFTLTVESGEETLTCGDVSIGEVFLCSGQSNMYLPMGDRSYYKDYFIDRRPLYEANTSVKQFRMSVGESDEPLFSSLSESSGWRVASDNNFLKFSPLPYFFAIEVQKQLNVPVGIVISAANGAPIQAFITKEDQEVEGVKSYYEDRKALYYNHMIAPLFPYSYSAVLWYQGESNAGASDGYDILQQRLVDSWRRELYAPDLPFYIAELAGWGDDRYAEVRELQFSAAEKQDNVHVISNSDLGDKIDNHPRQKDELGRRFALAYLGISQSMDVPYKAPALKEFKAHGSKMTVVFDNVYGGLKTSDGEEEVKGFLLAGTDGIFYIANGRIISSDTVELTSPDVDSPVNVRFAYKGYMEINLLGGSGICPLQFRTD